MALSLEKVPHLPVTDGRQIEVCFFYYSAFADDLLYKQGCRRQSIGRTVLF